MYTLHIANKHYSSWSLRPWLLMQQLGIAFIEQLHPFGAGSNWAEFRQFAPNGKVPCLVDEGQVVWDSLAIIEYLAERHPGVWPADTDARTWARCAAAEMHAGFSTLRNRCPMCCGLRIRLADMPDALRSDIHRINELWLEGLARFGGPFLAGDRFSAVDAFFAPVVFRVQSFDLPLDKPAADYAQRILGLPAMQQWYAAALAEPWRETDHENDILRTGTLLEDRRSSLAPGCVWR
jgi:glutathione S-transferase